MAFCLQTIHKSSSVQSKTLRASAYDQSPCCISSPLCSRTKTILVLFLQDCGSSSYSSSKCSRATILFFWVCNTRSVCSAFTAAEETCLNKKARSNQGENAMLPLRGLCHLSFADNEEKSNENKWVALCCRSLCLERIWSTNDNNTSWNGRYWNEITRKKARAEEKRAEFVCLDWGQSEKGRKKRFKWSI